MSVAALSLRDVSVVYGTGEAAVTALDTASADFSTGQSCSIVGRSGSGKSTLLSVMGLLRTPTTGHVLVDGEPVPRGSGAVARIRGEHVGMIFQSFHLEPRATALQNVLLPWHFAPRLSRRAAIARARECLERLEIGDLATRRVSDMSGGQRQRVAIARALLPEPKVVGADEPTGNLDEETGNLVARDLLGLRETGTAVVVVTHDPVIAGMADRTLTLTRGQLGHAS